ncbi:MAG: hypothetical protein ISP24_04440 [Rickettsiales bacterium]|nr:hypothetical protein [Rickettsiales bacterium]
MENNETYPVNSIEEFLEAFSDKQPLIYNLICNNLVVVEFTKDKIIFAEKTPTPKKLLNNIEDKTIELFGYKIQILLKDVQINAKTISEQQEEENNSKITAFLESSDYKLIKEIFPKAKIANVSNIKNN